MLDLSLPDSDGLDTVLQVRAAAPGLPIIVLTGLADLNLASEALEAGVHDYLVKHETNTQVLLRSIRYAIDRSALETSLREREADMGTLLDALPDVVLRVQRDGRATVLRPTSTGDDAVGQGRIEDVVSADSAKKLMVHIAEVLGGSGPVKVNCSTGPDTGRRVAFVSRRGPDEAFIVLRDGEHGLAGV